MSTSYLLYLSYLSQLDIDNNLFSRAEKPFMKIAIAIGFTSLETDPPFPLSISPAALASVRWPTCFPERTEAEDFHFAATQSIDAIQEIPCSSSWQSSW